MPISNPVSKHKNPLEDMHSLSKNIAAKFWVNSIIFEKDDKSAWKEYWTDKINFNLGRFKEFENIHWCTHTRKLIDFTHWRKKPNLWF